MNAADAKHDMYDPRKLDAMYQNLLAKQQAGTPQEYEIRVDDFPVVGKNNDPSRFMEYGEFITPETKHITVLLYRTNRQSDKFFFHLQPGSYKQAQELSGFHPSQLTPALSETELKDKIKKDLHYEEILKENVVLKKELEDYEKIFRNMNIELEQEKAGKKITFGQIGAFLVDGLVQSEFVKEKFPSIRNFSGFGNPEQQGKSEQQAKEGQQRKEEAASFRRKGETEEAEAEQEVYISEKEKKYLDLIKAIRTKCGDAELSNIMHLLDLVSENPKCTIYAIKMVTSYHNQKPEQTQNTTDEKI